MMFEYVLRVSSHTCAIRSARRHDASGVAREVQQERELLRRERDVAADCGARHDAAVSITRSPTTIGGGMHFAAPPRERAQPSEQLAEIERLGEVVVGAGIEAGDALLDGVERRQHQNGHLASRAREWRDRPRSRSFPGAARRE